MFNELVIYSSCSVVYYYAVQKSIWLSIPSLSYKDDREIVK